MKRDAFLFTPQITTLKTSLCLTHSLDDLGAIIYIISVENMVVVLFMWSPSSGLWWEHTEALLVLCGCKFPTEWHSDVRRGPAMSAECLPSHSSPAGSSCTSLRCQKARCSPKGQGGRVGTLWKGFLSGV